MTAILVDDDRTALDRMEELIFNHTRLTILASYSNPVEAKDAIIKQKPDLVFSDVEMPGITGIELAHSVKELGSISHFIFVTAFSQYAIKAIRESAFDYLLKPVDIMELKEAIARLEKENSEKNDREILISQEYGLSERETEILKLLLQGKSSSEMASTLNLSIHTINTHRKSLLSKTGLTNTHELILMVMNK